jgi:hypothetical protein
MVMIKLQMAVLVSAAALVAGLVGCSKDSVVTPPQALTDPQALQQAVATVDSVAQFSASDETTIDDNGMRSPEYDGLAKFGVDNISDLKRIFGDTVTAVRWGRHIFWNQVTRRYDAVISPGDSSALVTITKTLPGEFWVGVGQKTADTVIIDSVIKKPFTQVVTRKVRFIRVARTDNPLKNWVPVAITMVAGRTKPDSLNHFSIASLELEHVGQFDTTYTDPLQTWFRLGLFRGSIPQFRIGDSIRVRVTVNSAYDSAETAHLRYGIAGDGPERRRTVMRLVSTTGGSGNYTRVYERKFIVKLPMFMPPGILAVRFNAIVDILSWGSIYVSDAPFVNEFWGTPYVAVR